MCDLSSLPGDRRSGKRLARGLDGLDLVETRRRPWSSYGHAAPVHQRQDSPSHPRQLIVMSECARPPGTEMPDSCRGHLAGAAAYKPVAKPFTVTTAC